MAADLGVSLGNVQTVFESGAVNPPSPYYGEKAGIGGGAAVPVSAGQFSVNVQVQVIFEITY